MALTYDVGSGEDSNWIVAETDFDPRFCAKIESIFALQNGYMGVRAATEERLAAESRGCFIAGVFDAFGEEVTELANVPDWLSCQIELDGERFSTAAGALRAYSRSLDLRRGILRRELEWEAPSGRHTRLEFERFVSIHDLHAAALRVRIEPLDWEGKVGILSGLDGQVTNSGVQHFREGELRLFPPAVVAVTARAQQSGIGVCVAAAHIFRRQGEAFTAEEKVQTARRRISLGSRHHLRRGEVLEITKHAALHSDRDAGAPDAPLTQRTVDHLQACVSRGYDEMREEHARRWQSMWLFLSSSCLFSRSVVIV